MAKLPLRTIITSTSLRPWPTPSLPSLQLTSSKLDDPCWPHQHCVTPCDLIKAGRPTEPRGLTTGPKKTPHPLGCQEHCKCEVSAPAIFTVMPNSPTPHPSYSPDNGAAEPPALPATMSAHVGWQQWQRGVPDGEACCRMGLLLSVWAMSQVITSTQLIHHAPQTDTNKEDTFLPPLPLPHSSPLQPFLSSALSMRAKAGGKKEDQSSGSPSLFEAMGAPEESARWFSNSRLLVQICGRAKMMGSQKGYMEWGGVRETGDKGWVKTLTEK